VIVKESVVLIPVPDHLATISGCDAGVVDLVVIVVFVAIVSITEVVVDGFALFTIVVLVQLARIRGNTQRINNLFMFDLPSLTTII
jgi:hypothetical protein